MLGEREPAHDLLDDIGLHVREQQAFFAFLRQRLAVVEREIPAYVDLRCREPLGAVKAGDAKDHLLRQLKLTDAAAARQRQDAFVVLIVDDVERRLGLFGALDQADVRIAAQRALQIDDQRTAFATDNGQRLERQRRVSANVKAAAGDEDAGEAKREGKPAFRI